MNEYVQRFCLHCGITPQSFDYYSKTFGSLMECIGRSLEKELPILCIFADTPEKKELIDFLDGNGFIVEQLKDEHCEGVYELSPIYNMCIKTVDGEIIKVM